MRATLHTWTISQQYQPIKFSFAIRPLSCSPLSLSLFLLLVLNSFHTVSINQVQSKKPKLFSGYSVVKALRCEGDFLSLSLSFFSLFLYFSLSPLLTNAVHVHHHNAFYSFENTTMFGERVAGKMREGVEDMETIKYQGRGRYTGCQRKTSNWYTYIRLMWLLFFTWISWFHLVFSRPCTIHFIRTTHNIPSIMKVWQCYNVDNNITLASFYAAE